MPREKRLVDGDVLDADDALLPVPRCDPPAASDSGAEGCRGWPGCPEAGVETVVDIRILNYSKRYPTDDGLRPKDMSSPPSASSSNANRPATIPPAINRFVDLFAETVKDIARVRLPVAGRGKHLRCEFLLPGSKKSGQILALGHSDTVWPLGTLRTMPFRQSHGRLWGPGVFDMKAGLVFFIFAMRALREQDVPVARKVVLQVNSDEEVGSPSSQRPHRGSRAKERRRAGARTQPGTRRQTQNRPQRRRRLHRHRPRPRRARRTRFRERRQRDRRDGPADSKESPASRASTAASPSAPA